MYENLTSATGRRGVHISKVSLTRNDDAVEISFDVHWSGSWRCHAQGPASLGIIEDALKPPNERCDNNWDAAWVFAKYRVTEVLPLGDSRSVEEILNASDEHGLRRLALQQGYAPPVVLDWFGGNLLISPTQKSARWSVVQEGVSTTSSSGPVERTVDTFEIVKDSSGQYQAQRQSRWQHVYLSNSNADHHAPAGAKIKCARDGTGVFIYRSEDNCGVGPVQFSDVRLRWDIVSNEIQFMKEISIWVFGVEMVYIPENTFHLGDPLGPKGPESCFYDALKEGKDLTYRVESEDEIQVGERAGPFKRGKLLYYSDDESVAGKGDQRGTIPKEFPKGYKAFYMMKRQITQGEYADFINTLKGSAKTSRFPYWTGDYRYAIFWGKSGDRIAMRPMRACNWLSWLDGISFAAWAGLRPMTELEYEKACRGPLEPISGEYAWGDTTIQQAQVIVGLEDGTESVNGNANFENFKFLGGDGDTGPLRDDAFGMPGNPNTLEIYPPGRASFWKTEDEDGFHAVPRNVRRQTGCSYYGVMGLSGNLWELCITVGKKAGRQFSGRHGSGVLSVYGSPDTEELGWPGSDGDGAGFRGGSWYTGRGALRVADRTYGSGLIGWYSGRSHDTGFRCVRTAPDE